ncbi:MAG: ATP phosphoribosyltransferase [Candidatus Tectimicrobiota bacterium]
MAGGLTIALPKGRVLEGALTLLKKVGLDCQELDVSRKLILELPERQVRFLLLRNSDVPTYVEYGAADIGIVGKDVLLEQQKDIYEPLDLQFGLCRLVVAQPKHRRRAENALHWSSNIKVATKFPRLTEEHFNRKGIQVEIIYLGGSVELAPLVGLSDLVVDLVQTGRTLQENGLVEVEEILRSTARLVVNRASQKTKYEPIRQLIQQIRAYLS